MSQAIVLAGRDLGRLVGLAIDLGAVAGSPTLIETVQPVDYLAKRPLPERAVAIVLLNGTENIGDLISLFKANPQSDVLLLSDAYPPRAAVARVVAEHHAAWLPANESPMVIAATVIALLCRRGAVAV